MIRHRALHQAAALLLSYPGPAWPRHAAEVTAALTRLNCPEGELLLDFCRATAPVPPLELAARYVTTFDRSRRRTLHLTHYTDGDTRRRGASLAALKAHYRAAGWEPDAGELPDFLPALLEFAARCPRAGTPLLHQYRGALGLLAQALDDYRSPYVHVLRAVQRTLPAAPPPAPVPDAPAPVPFPMHHALGDEGVRR
ncbi:nitrate reductase molybdenum cofactor assembly chaperone [Streptomyces sp. GS7]|uniref:nitrate reductase molybdenum cofactor assembly chaperone n=1 Tax=Streptomyces sp. GS7 TaxID=2692234 RepID=UPI001316494E|nr:nitrate reductase molybdenum cofactor assembly chaperone [Streptomyces sp. GS7]QHC22775.1 nitrate reductase molybdenum cofactor assembly chaperone [Streptomyces sp. GS7]